MHLERLLLYNSSWLYNYISWSYLFHLNAYACMCSDFPGLTVYITIRATYFLNICSSLVLNHGCPQKSNYVLMRIINFFSVRYQCTRCSFRHNHNITINRIRQFCYWVRVFRTLREDVCHMGVTWKVECFVLFTYIILQYKILKPYISYIFMI